MLSALCPFLPPTNSDPDTATGLLSGWVAATQEGAHSPRWLSVALQKARPFWGGEGGTSGLTRLFKSNRVTSGCIRINPEASTPIGRYFLNRMRKRMMANQDAAGNRKKPRGTGLPGPVRPALPAGCLTMGPAGMGTPGTEEAGASATFGDTVGQSKNNK